MDWHTAPARPPFTTKSNQRRHISQNAPLANTRRPLNAGLMLPHRRRRWANIKPALGNCLCFLSFKGARLSYSVTLSFPFGTKLLKKTDLFSTFDRDTTKTFIGIFIVSCPHNAQKQQICPVLFQCRRFYRLRLCRDN